jgi:FMN-dependent NADH-azoreductase
MKLLFVNACMRGKESRTHQLCMDYLEKFLRAKKEEDWHRKLKKNAERKKLKSNALPTAKAL